MFGFDANNSIEPAATVHAKMAPKPDPAETPIREATPTEMRTLQNRPSPINANTDAVTKQHGLYTADWRSVRIYYTDYQQKSEVMRANPERITSKLDDRQTVSAMLDLAQSRGWEAVKLRGSDSFRREAWVQAQVRGIEAKGYRPKETDLQEAARRQVVARPVAKAAKTVNPLNVSAAPPPTQKQSTAKTQTTASQQRKAAVWGAVETAGKQARGQDAQTTTQAQSAEPTQKVPTPQPAAHVA